MTTVPSAVCFLVLVVLVLAGAGCGDTRLGRSTQQEVQVVLAVTAVPSDVACVRLTVAGMGRTVTREVEVMAGADVTESFGGLPLGTAEFLGEAFTGDCKAVTKATIAAWVSEPAEESIILGRIANVALTLHRNGRAKVTLDFADEGTCQPPGADCLTSAECCSRSCTRGVCRPRDGGAPDGD
jgi:hypothetical protein